MIGCTFRDFDKLDPFVRKIVLFIKKLDLEGRNLESGFQELDYEKFKTVLGYLP